MGIDGLLHLAPHEAYNWRYGAYLGQDMQNSGIVLSTPSYQAEVAGRFANTIWYDEASDGRGYAHWAIAGTVADTDGNAGSNSTARFQSRPEARTQSRWFDTGVITGAEFYEILALEGVLNLGPVQVVGEYESLWLQRDNATDIHFDGGYMYVSYFLTGENMVWERATGQLGRVKPFQHFFIVDTCDDGIESGWGAWQVAVRYSATDLSSQNIRGGEGEELTLGVNWYWNDYARMQFNYIYGHIDNHAPVDGQTTANFQIIGARFCVDF
jgi:phosphate-selective porin OprO/OprP